MRFSSHASATRALPHLSFLTPPRSWLSAPDWPFRSGSRARSSGCRQGLQTVLCPRVVGLDQATRPSDTNIAESHARRAKAIRHGVLLPLPAALLLRVLLLVGVPLLSGPQFHQAVWLGFILLPGTLM